MILYSASTPFQSLSQTRKTTNSSTRRWNSGDIFRSIYLHLPYIYCNVVQMHFKILRYLIQVFIVYLYMIFGIPICNTQAILSHLHYIAVHRVLFQVIGELG